MEWPYDVPDKHATYPPCVSSHAWLKVPEICVTTEHFISQSPQLRPTAVNSSPLRRHTNRDCVMDLVTCSCHHHNIKKSNSFSKVVESCLSLYEWSADNSTSYLKCPKLPFRKKSTAFWWGYHQSWPAAHMPSFLSSPGHIFNLLSFLPIFLGKRAWLTQSCLSISYCQSMEFIIKFFIFTWKRLFSKSPVSWEVFESIWSGYCIQLCERLAWAQSVSLSSSLPTCSTKLCPLHERFSSFLLVPF